MSEALPSKFAQSEISFENDGLLFRDHRRAQWLALICALTLVSAMFLYPAWLQRATTLSREKTHLQEQAKLIELSLTRSLSGVSHALEAVRDELPLYRHNADGWRLASQRMKDFVDAVPGVHGMFILDSYGTARAFGTVDSVRIPHPKGNFATKAYFQTVVQHPNSDTLYVSAPFVTDVGVWTFTLTRAIFTPQGAFDGVVVATINLDDYQLWLGSARYVQDQYASIVHGQGIQILREPSEDAKPGRNLAMPGTFFSRHVASGNDTTVMQGKGPNPPDKEVLLVAHTVQPGTLHMDQPLFIGVGRVTDTILAPWYSLMQGRVVMLVLLWTVSVAALWTWQRSRVQTLAQQRAQSRLIDQFFESPLSFLAVLGADGSCMRLSEGWREAMGWDLRVLRGQTLLPFVHPDDLPLTQRARQTLESQGRVDRYFCRLRDVKGVYHEFQIQAAKLDGLQYIDARDVTQEREAQRALQSLNHQLIEKEEKLIHLAQRDGLTQLANRRTFDEDLSREWRRCGREHKPLSLLMVDIDHFKRYNDHYGHLAGDTCLKTVANAMVTCMRREGDLLARYGGEEFVVLLPNTPLDGASLVAQDLCDAVRRLDIPHADSAVAKCITLSIGFQTVIPDESQPSTSLIHKADMALYQAKKQGRNRVVSGALAADITPLTGEYSA